MRTINCSCRMCGVTFSQPDDPGRKREFCSNACRQRAYRARGGRASGTRRESARQRQRRVEEEAWAREEARREQERQRSERRRQSEQGNRAQAPNGVPGWCHPQGGDDAIKVKWRRVCRLLWERGSHPTANDHEATACREKATKIRERYGL